MVRERADESVVPKPGSRGSCRDREVLQDTVTLYKGLPVYFKKDYKQKRLGTLDLGKTFSHTSK